MKSRRPEQQGTTSYAAECAPGKQFAALPDTRAGAASQRKLMNVVNGSPRVAQQAVYSEWANNKASPLQLMELTGRPARAAALSGNAPAIVQRLTYRDQFYRKEDSAGFKVAAIKDLEEQDFVITPAVNGALGALGAHDETANIPTVEKLIGMLTLSPIQTGLQGELDTVTDATGRVTGAVDPSIVKIDSTDIDKVATVGGHMDTVKTQIGVIEGVPVQDQALGANKKKADDVKVEVGTQPGSARTKLGQIRKWAAEFPGKMLLAATRWHALGSLGVSVDSGPRHLNIGPKTETESLATGRGPESGGTLWSTPWSPGINAEWIKAGSDNALDFNLVVPPPPEIALTLVSGNLGEFVNAAKADAQKHVDDPENSHYWNTNTNTLTRLGQEVYGLLQQGYRLVVE